jgi:hypothetical protein
VTLFLVGQQLQSKYEANSQNRASIQSLPDRKAQGWPVKSIIYVQHCLIPPVTLQTSPRDILEPWT